MVPYLSDPDVTLYHGDVLATLREFPAESVDCAVTSPPYWGLRDYGIGDQIGLEPTPEQYVERMVEVFREVRRVLAAHGTVWLNLGDSYTSTAQGTFNAPERIAGAGSRDGERGQARARYRPFTGLKPKDLVGIPWRVAFALQADGWYLRSDVIWAKPNPMPESVTDRPTKAHEYVFLLSKQPRYFFDQEAVREPAEWARWGDQTVPKYEGTETATGWMENGKKEDLQARAAAGRNIRSVWSIATQPYPEAHFATFPEELARRCIAAGCPEQVCRVCGKARERVVQTVETREQRPSWAGEGNAHGVRGGNHKGRTGNWGSTKEELGWTECNCQTPQTTTSSSVTSAETLGTSRTALAERTGSSSALSAKWRTGIVLDPFIGSGTVAYVARKLHRHSIGIDLNAEYLELAARRLQQQSLFT